MPVGSRLAGSPRCGFDRALGWGGRWDLTSSVQENAPRVGGFRTAFNRGTSPLLREGGEGGIRTHGGLTTPRALQARALGQTTLPLRGGLYYTIPSMFCNFDLPTWRALASRLCSCDGSRSGGPTAQR